MSSLSALVELVRNVLDVLMDAVSFFRLTVLTENLVGTVTASDVVSKGCSTHAHNTSTRTEGRALFRDARRLQVAATKRHSRSDGEARQLQRMQ